MGCVLLLVAPAQAATPEEPGGAAATAGGVTVPALAPLSAAVVARQERPARVAFLGSSTTYGAGVQDPAQAYVALVLAGLRSRHPAGQEQPPGPVSLYSPAGTLPDSPGLHALNGGVVGATSATYLSPRALRALRRSRPACVVHMIGSNDSVSGTDPAQYERSLRDGLRRVDAAVPRPRPCHVLVHAVRRLGVRPERWAAYGAAMRQVADAAPRATFLDVSGAFESQDALGADPADLIAPDRVHPGPAGHALIADLLLDHLTDGIGSRSQLRRLDSDGDGVPDRRELHRGTDPQRPGPRR